jgi:hypothetical protein
MTIRKQAKSSITAVLSGIAMGFLAFTCLGGSSSSGGLDSLVNSYHQLYLTAVSAGDKRAAFLYLKLYDRCNDSIEFSRRLAERKAFEARYNNEAKSKQIDLLRKQEEISKIRLNQSRVTLYAFSGAVILIPLMLLLIFWQMRLKASSRELKLEQTLLLSHMNPHFIFNTMANIQALIVRNETELSLKYLAGFSGLVSNILESSGAETISLEKEEAIITEYIRMQKLRFGDKFDFCITFGEELDKKTVRIPPMLSQPFIENALDHGIRYKEGNGFLQVRFRKENRQFIIEIEDDGVGRTVAKEKESMQERKHTGITIPVTMQRLEALGNRRSEQGKLWITDLLNDDGSCAGTLVRIEVRM